MLDLQPLVDTEFSYLVKTICVRSVCTKRKERSFMQSVGVFHKRKNFPTEVSEVSEYRRFISLLKSLTVGDKYPWTGLCSQRLGRHCVAQN